LLLRGSQMKAAYKEFTRILSAFVYKSAGHSLVMCPVKPLFANHALIASDTADVIASSPSLFLYQRKLSMQISCYLHFLFTLKSESFEMSRFRDFAPCSFTLN